MNGTADHAAEIPFGPLDFTRARRNVANMDLAGNSRHIADGHDRQLTGCPIYCPSEAVRGGIQRAQSGYSRLSRAVIQSLTSSSKF